jgi:hypothetical protein
MTTTTLSVLKKTLLQDHIFALGILMVTINVIYILSSHLLLKHYQKQTSKLAPFGKFVCFRIFDKTYISNYPSKSAKKFFGLQNKITISFNFIIAMTFLTYALLIIKSL